MMVGIIGAMNCEVDQVIEKMNIINTSDIAMMKFYMGTLKGVNIVVVCCGIGKVNAAIGTQLLIDRFNVSYIINTGVAGAISEELDIGDVVISNDVTYHDFDPLQLVRSYPWMPDIFIKADDELIKISQKACESIPIIKKVYVGRIVSGDKFLSDSEEKKVICSRLSAHCIEMEGASVAHVCYVNMVPFIIIRSISDKADDSASISFREFLKTVSEQSNHIICNIIGELKDFMTQITEVNISDVCWGSKK